MTDGNGVLVRDIARLETGLRDVGERLDEERRERVAADGKLGDTIASATRELWGEVNKLQTRTEVLSVRMILTVGILQAVAIVILSKAVNRLWP